MLTSAGSARSRPAWAEPGERYVFVAWLACVCDGAAIGARFPVGRCPLASRRDGVRVRSYSRNTPIETRQRCALYGLRDFEIIWPRFFRAGNNCVRGYREGNYFGCGMAMCEAHRRREIISSHRSEILEPPSAGGPPCRERGREARLARGWELSRRRRCSSPTNPRSRYCRSPT
jgi:hypothetical protein